MEYKLLKQWFPIAPALSLSVSPKLNIGLPGLVRWSSVGPEVWETETTRHSIRRKCYQRSSGQHSDLLR